MSNEHITNEQIDRICYMATEIRFAKTDEAAQAVIDKIRVALRPAAQPASSTILNKEVLLLLADVRDALGHPDNVALVDRLAYLITGGLPVEWVRRHVKPNGWTDVVIVRDPGRPPKDDERGTWMPRLVVDAGTIELGVSAPNIPMPTTEEEAAAMQMLGQAWLQQHAPHRLKPTCTE